MDDCRFSIDDGDETLTLRVTRDRLYGRGQTRFWPQLVLRAIGTLLALYGVLPLLVWIMRLALRLRPAHAASSPDSFWLDVLVNETVPGLGANVLVIYVAATIMLAAFYG
jgi:hypothetical protein